MSTTRITPHDAGDNVIELRPRAEAESVEQDDVVLPQPDAAGDDAVGGTVSEMSVARPAAPEAPLEHKIEALLFVSSTPITVEAMAAACQEDAEEVEDALLEMMTRYSDVHSGIVLERVSGGWALRASDTVRDVLARMFEPQADTRLSPAAMETLAVVAYLQPVSRPDVARIRGVSVDAAMTSLLDKGFVEEAGRGDTGAVMFRTTPLFERAFGLSSLGALPELEGFGPGADETERLRAQLEQMAAARVD